MLSKSQMKTREYKKKAECARRELIQTIGIKETESYMRGKLEAMQPCDRIFTESFLAENQKEDPFELAQPKLEK